MNGWLFNLIIVQLKHKEKTVEIFCLEIKRVNKKRVTCDFLKTG